MLSQRLIERISHLVGRRILRQSAQDSCGRGLRLPLLRLAGTAGLIAAFWRPGQAAAPAGSAVCPDCNIVLIGLDTLRPGNLGCYGYSKPTSPAIDGFTRHATVFDRFILQAYLTPISMASILTSEYPSNSGYTSFSSSLDTATVTLPEILNLYGYATAASWTSPEFFTEVAVSSNGYGASPKRSFQRGFDFVFHPSTSTHFRDVPGPEIIDWIHGNRDRKFFVWIGLGTTHWPYGRSAPARLKKKFYSKNSDARGVSRLEVNRIVNDCYYPIPMALRPRSSTAPACVPLTPDDREFLAARYDAGVSYADEFVGRVLAALKTLRLTRKTVVVIFSVHSEELGERGVYGHYDIHNPELRGALIVSDPRLPHPPARAAQLVTGLDLTPTILDIAGIRPRRQAQGRSFAEVLEGSTAPVNAFAFSERIPLIESVLYDARLRPDADKDDPFVAYLAPVFDVLKDPSEDTSVQDLRWKLIHRRSGAVLSKASLRGFVAGAYASPPEYELYDLAADPLELRNVMAENPGPAARLTAELAKFEKSLSRRSPHGRPTQIIPYP
ncbi:MAG: sulfatase [Elusimicrobiota bacterium]